MIRGAALLLPLALASSAALAQTADTITVTATRTPSKLADTAASVVVISGDAIASTAAPTTDDALRQVTGFTLFRRTGSRTANPTSQGVSLRGVGASGASRALVLDDGVPLNDPFGGWVYWARVPRAALDRIEVLQGGASDLYGSAAMGGVIQSFRRSPAIPMVVVDSSAGSERTATTSLFAAAQGGPWHASLAADIFTTEGFTPIAEEQRGAVDTAAGGRHVAVDATLERTLGASTRLFLRGSRFLESRHNGTPLQTNDTSIEQLAGGIDAGALLIRVYGSSQHYHQTFSAISSDRKSERLTVDQEVPSRGSGASGQWMHVMGKGHALLAGVEMRHVSGASDEDNFGSAGVTSTRAGGKQNTVAAFVEDVAALTNNLSATGGLRLDGWRNYEAERGGVALGDRSERAWSPRLSILYRRSERLSFAASAYRAFRAPTLNELYRGFRVGNVVTLPNESLGAERLSGIELSARTASVRVTTFWMTTDDVVANVTLSSTPSLITRQRQNLGRSRSRGVELEGDWKLFRDWSISAGYLFCDSTIIDGTLAGRRAPQVPRNQATLQLSHVTTRTKSAAQLRWSSAQFDDDLNQFRLRGFFATDLFTSFALRPSVALTLSLENVFNRRVEAAATPVVALAQPRAWRIGFRVTR